MKKLITLMFFLLLTSKCFAEKTYIKLADKAMIDFCKKMAIEKKLYVIGTGGSMMKDIKEVSLHFISFDHLKLKDARSLYVEMVELFLNKVNSDDRMVPYLHNYPFTVKNFDLTLDFREKKDQDHICDPKCISLIFHKDQKDIIHYCTFDHISNKFIDVHQETYDEAKRIVQNEGVEKNLVIGKS